MDSIAKRLGYFIKNQGIKISKLELELGFTNGRISKAIERDSDIKHEVIDKIVEKFPHLSKYWLETGQGNMLVYENVATKEDNKNKDVMPEEMRLRQKIEDLQQRLIDTDEDIIKENKKTLEKLENLYERLLELERENAELKRKIK